MSGLPLDVDCVPVFLPRGSWEVTQRRVTNWGHAVACVGPRAPYACCSRERIVRRCTIADSACHGLEGRGYTGGDAPTALRTPCRHPYALPTTEIRTKVNIEPGR